MFTRKIIISNTEISLNPSCFYPPQAKSQKILMKKHAQWARFFTF